MTTIINVSQVSDSAEIYPSNPVTTYVPDPPIITRYNYPNCCCCSCCNCCADDDF